MNQKDLKIIAHLRQNARIPLTKMSKKINIPVSTIFDKLKDNEENLIIKHTSLLDFSRLGYHTRANINLKVERENKEELKEFLLKHPSINSLYRVSGGFDFLIEGIFKQIKDMEDFIEEVEKRFKILDKKSYFIIDDLKREEFMADTELVELFHKQ